MNQENPLATVGFLFAQIFSAKIGGSIFDRPCSTYSPILLPSYYIDIKKPFATVNEGL